jgi:tellurite methyltransferase
MEASMDRRPHARLERLLATPGWRGGRVLDVRPAVVYAAGHLHGAVSLPLDPAVGADPQRLAAQLPSIFLPPRRVPLLVVAETAGFAETVAAHLRGRGRPAVAAIALPAGEGSALPSEYLETGPTRRRLWDPPSWLRSHEGLLPPPALGPVLDLGCGSGRASVWLAERGYRVIGIDHQSAALALGARLAASQGVDCRFVQADLRRPDALAEGGWGLVVNVRFLHRPLLDRLGSLLVPGGVAVVRTFREAPGYTGHPRPKHRLRRGELLAAFPRPFWSVLAHQEDHDADGRPGAGVVARRRTG